MAVPDKTIETRRKLSIVLQKLLMHNNSNKDDFRFESWKTNNFQYSE